MLLGAAFLSGLGLSVFLVLRGQVGADQINLLARGWLLAEEGRFVPYGNPTSAGGYEAGGTSTVLVGLPLSVWRDSRAPVVLILAFHIIAFWLLDRILREAAGTEERLVFAIVYWLSPWRLYYSGFLWNPNYLFLAGAVHAWSLWRQRLRGDPWLSLVHAASVGLALQLHPSSIWMAVATLLLWMRGYSKLHWRGAAAGVLLVALSLVPWLVAVVRDPSLLPGDKGFPGRGLVYVFPVLRGVLFWLRYGSLCASGKILRFDLASTSIEIAAKGLAAVAGAASLACALLANLRLWRHGARFWRRHPPDAPGRAWLLGYARLSFVAAVISFALAPTTVMDWQGLVLFHAAVLPVTLWAGALARTRRAPIVKRAGVVWCAASLVLGIAIGAGSPRYHCVQRTFEVPPLRYDHPMFHELGIQDRCPLVTNDPSGWWTDLLPRPSAENPESQPARP